MTTLEEIADELYGLPPEEFTAARDARACALRASDRALADAVCALRRPTTAAWLVDLLVRERRTTSRPCSPSATRCGRRGGRCPGARCAAWGGSGGRLVRPLAYAGPNPVRCLGPAPEGRPAPLRHLLRPGATGMTTRRHAGGRSPRRSEPR